VSTATAQLYETDFYGWIQQQAGALRAGNFASLDLDNLTEEIESMGRSEHSELESRIELLLMHLLKWQHQPTFKAESWQLTIIEQRKRIMRHLRKNPSLKRFVAETYEESYGYAVLEAAKETGLDQSTFPAECPWTFEQAMDSDF